MQAFRVSKRQYPAFDSTRAFLKGARWNSRGKAVIYAAQSYATALIEVLVHAQLDAIPKHHVVVTIEIPDDILIETADLTKVPGWDKEDSETARAFGDHWLDELRSAVLVVPSVVLQGRESNVLINPVHPDFHRVTAGEPEPVIWDPRLFSRQQ